MTSVLDALEAQLCIDQNSVFSTGMSNGAIMSVRLACSLSSRIAAIAPVAGAYYPPDALNINPAEMCPDKRPVPMIAFHGTADTVVPFNGGLGGMSGTTNFRLPLDTTMPVENVMGDWSTHNGCASGRQESQVSTEVRLVQYTACTSGAVVQLYAVDGGGHTWPGAIDVPRLGYTTHQISATDLIWAFFAAHPFVYRTVLSSINELMASAAGYPGGSASVQYVEVKDLADSQNIVSHARVTAFSADGTSFTVLKTLDHDLPSTATIGKTFIVASGSFAAAAGITPDFTFDTGAIPATGQICWGAPGAQPPTDPSTWDAGNIANYIDCLAYNGYTGTGSAAVSSPPQSPLDPTNGTMALLRHSETGNNAADFVLQCPRPVNFAGNMGSFGACNPTCPWDLSFPATEDFKVGLDDLLLFAAAYNSTPSSSNWNPRADFDNSGRVGLGDLLALAFHYNQQPCP
jgi:hypothetical protein